MHLALRGFSCATIITLWSLYLFPESISFSLLFKFLWVREFLLKFSLLWHHYVFLRKALWRLTFKQSFILKEEFSVARYSGISCFSCFVEGIICSPLWLQTTNIVNLRYLSPGNRIKLLPLLFSCALSWWCPYFKYV